MSHQSNISILIIEDEVIVAMDIGRKIEKLGYDVAEIKHSFEEAKAYLEIHTPDLILCDINIKGSEDGISIAQINQNTKKIPLIFVTALSDRKTLDRAKKSLPYGYIVKPFNQRDLLTAIELALYKHSVEVDKISLTNEKLSDIIADDLSTRELELLQDLVNGLTNHQISKERFISLSTVKFHIGNVFQKMEVNNRAEVMRKILQLVT